MTDSSGAGHGGLGAPKSPMDPGAIGSGTTEHKEVYWVNQQFIATGKLKDVTDYKAGNVNQNLVNIVANTNAVSKSGELTFSHHMNAFNGKATGVEVWYYLGDAKGKALAEKLSAAIAKELGIANRGAKATTALYVVAYTNATCLLIEWCFVDNWSDIASWNKNKTKAVNAALNILGYKKGGGQPVTPISGDYLSDKSHLEAKEDLKTYNRSWTKVDKTWLLKKGTKFGVDLSRKVVTSSGTVHAPIYGLQDTYVTLAKTHVKPQ